jgi:leader peptidase (prepilin peptidase)/N-methyltransferase
VPLLLPVLGLLLGLVVGSFVATLVLRWPAGRSVAVGRSACDGCGRRLRWYELLPIASYVAQRGRCRTCDAAIDERHPLIELACGFVGALALALHPDATGLAGAAFGWALVALVALDSEHFWLPDAVTLPLLGAGLAVGLVLPPTLADRLLGAAGGYASLALVAAVYRALRGRTGLGGGDPKLFAAIGAWLGWQALPFVLLLASVAGLVAIALRALRGERLSPTTRVPLGALLGVAAWPLWLLFPGGLSSI